MKKYSSFTKISLIMLFFIPVLSFGQELVDEETFRDATGHEFKVGDDLNIGKPGSEKGYKYIQNATKKKIGWMGKMASKVSEVGKNVAEVGADLGSGNTVAKGAQVHNTANSTSNLTQTGEKLLTNEEDIEGQTLRILKFKVVGNEKRGEHFFAVVAGPGKANYEVEIVPAIRSGEVVGLNDSLFNTEK